MRHDEVSESLGAYVLGALEPGERADVESHLAGCAACRDAVSDLAAMPGLLGRLSVDEAEAGLDVQPASGESALRVVEGERRQHRRQLRAWQIAAGILALALIVVTPFVVGDRSSDSVELRPITDAGAATVAGTVTVTPRDWGMQVKLDVRDLPPRRGYALVAVADDGHEAMAASWAATDAGAVQLTGACYMALDRLDRMHVVSDGEVLAVFRP